MLARVFDTLCKEEDSACAEWLLDVLSADQIAALSLEDDLLVITARKGERQKDFKWSSEDLLRNIEDSGPTKIAGEVAWQLLMYYDLYYDTDDLLRSYITRQGVVVEKVPFRCVDGHLVVDCALSSDALPDTDSSKLQLCVDKNSMTVLLPLDNTDLFGLFCGRLRRLGL